MNNIVATDIDQNRPAERQCCYYCKKEFAPFEPRELVFAVSWSRYDAHPKCAKKKARKP